METSACIPSSAATGSQALSASSNSTLFSTRSEKSKDKVIRFFGDDSIPLSAGKGSLTKLESFYGVSMFRGRRQSNALLSPASPTVDALVDFPVPTKSAENTQPFSLAPSQSVESMLDQRRPLGRRKHSVAGSVATLVASSDSEGEVSPTTLRRRRSSLPSLPSSPIGDYAASLQENSFDHPLPDGSTRKAGSSSGWILPALTPHPAVRKIVGLVGSEHPVDIPVRDISAEGLPTLLESRLPLCYFLLHLLKESNSEILFFILDVKKFETSLFDSTSAQNAEAERIFNTFLAQSAFLEVNISHKAKRAVIDGIQRGLRWCFAAAAAECITLLERSFAYFKKSDGWTKMERDIGVSRIVSHDQVEVFRPQLAALLDSNCQPSAISFKRNQRSMLVHDEIAKLVSSRINLLI
ncbi:hypothetical protein DFJ73DRAFT_828864 [Zopfochytrium polystomum]|nr:hypothetical protein DFJ73DRAFT_828864 [Zopfochytrium polystomum]